MAPPTIAVPKHAERKRRAAVSRSEQRPPLLARELVEIEEQIGEGGMGVVFKGRRRDTGETIAIKMLGSRFASQPQFAARFAREIELMSRAELGDCPYLARYLGHSIDVDTGEYLVFMEYLTGGTLRQQMAGRPLGLEDIGRLLPQICTGLSWLHIHGIVHRDLKPENVMFNERGIAKLTDLGLAKTVHGNRRAATLTRTRTVMGTHYYMSPEQRADSKRVGPASDIFSVGVMLYEMLTGTIPSGPAQPVSALCPWKLPPRMDQAIARMLASNPRDRYQTAEDVAWVFRKIIGDDFWWAGGEGKPWRQRPPEETPLEGFEAPPEEPVGPPVDLAAEARALAAEPPPPPPQGHSARWAWATRIAALAGLLFVGLTAREPQPPPESRPLPRPPETASGPLTPSPPELPHAAPRPGQICDLERSQALALLTGVARTANWFAVVHEGRPATAEELYPAGGPPPDPWGSPVLVSPSRHSVATAGPDRLPDTSDDLVMKLWSPAQLARAQLAWLAGRRPVDPDSGWLAPAVEARPAWRDPWGRPVLFPGPLAVSMGPDGRLSSDDLIDQKSDGEMLVYARGPATESQIWLGDRGGQWELQLTFDSARARLPRWSPDGRWIAYVAQSDQGCELVTVRPDRSDRRSHGRLPQNQVTRELRWLRDGRTLLVAFSSAERPRTLSLLLCSTEGPEEFEFAPPEGTRLRLGPAVAERELGFAVVLDRGDEPAASLEIGLFGNLGEPASRTIELPAGEPVAMWFSGPGGPSLFVTLRGSGGRLETLEFEPSTGRLLSTDWTAPEPLASVAEGPFGQWVAAAGVPGRRRLLTGPGRGVLARAVFDDRLERDDPDLALCRLP